MGTIGRPIGATDESAYPKDMTYSQAEVDSALAAQKTIIENQIIGVNQTWQDVLSSRAFTTIYTNNTGKPISIAVTTKSATSTDLCELNIKTDSITTYFSRSYTAGVGGYSSIVTGVVTVPDNSTYQVVRSALNETLLYWAELREVV